LKKLNLFSLFIIPRDIRINMKIISWNINGLGNALKKGHLETLVSEHKPDILCLQEVRCSNPKPIEGLTYTFFHCAARKGYSGTSISCNIEPLAVMKGFENVNVDIIDDEGRIIVAEFREYFVISVYVPNSKPDLSRLDYRIKWDAAFSKLLETYQKKKHVIVCGDYNVAHMPIDIYNPKGKDKQHGYTPEERESFSKLLGYNKLVDTFREIHKNTQKFSWWSNFAKSRERNVGWRIDYILISSYLKNKIKSVDILTSHMGSDHAPLECVM